MTRGGVPLDLADTRRRRLAFRCWHRGMREMDLILGRFADARLAELGEENLSLLERLLDVPDPELFGWIAGSKPIPANHDTTLLAEIREFHETFPTSKDAARP